METIVQAVLKHGREHPDKLAVALKDQQMTYGVLCERISSAAQILSESYGIQTGFSDCHVGNPVSWSSLGSGR